RPGADELHEGKPAHETGPPRGEMKRQRRAPVLRHQIGALDSRRRNERVEIADVIAEAIRDVRLARLAEPDQVGRNAMRDRRDMRQDVAPDERRSWIAVQEQRDWPARSPGLAIGHGGIEDSTARQCDVGIAVHGFSSLKTVAKAMVLKR